MWRPRGAVINQARLEIADSGPVASVRCWRQELSALNPSCVIHREYPDGSTPYRRETLDNRPPEAEMFEPTVMPGIKQWHNLASNRIDTSQVRAFAEIAAVTGEGQIAGIVGPTMLARYDVLDVMRKGRTILGKEAIFTTVPGSGSDKYPRRRFHRYAASESCLRAFSLRIATKSSALMSA